MEAQQNFDTRPMTVGEWFFTILILGIPLVNIVMYLVWGFGSSGNLNRRNFCRAAMLWAVIGIALFILFVVLAGGLAVIMRQFSYTAT